MCVCTICIDVKILYCAGGQQPIFLCCPTKLRKMWWMGSWTHEPVPAIYIYNIYIYIYILYIIRPWAHLSRSWGDVYLIAVVLYSQCLLWLYLSLYIYIFIVTFHSSCLFIVDVFARPMHFTSEFAMTVLRKCVCVCEMSLYHALPISQCAEAKDAVGWWSVPRLQTQISYSVLGQSESCDCLFCEKCAFLF